MTDKHSDIIARRMQHIAPFHVMELLARAKQLEAQGREIVHMEIGEPDFVTPAPVMESASNALASGFTHYTPATGLPELKEKISQYYRQVYQVDITPQRIIITPGASGALLLALGVLINAGDKVMMSDPGYPCNRHFVRMFDGEDVSVPVSGDSQYQLTADVIRAQDWRQCKAIMLATPSNPTGTLLSPEQLQDIVNLTAGSATALLVDEIYQGLVYGADPCSVARFTDQAFIINSFSKYFCMTGWRLGWLVAPAAYQREVDILAQNIFLAPSTLAQHAALAAFDDNTLAILEQQRQQFQQRRDFLMPALQDMGFEIAVQPQGAFYIYAGCSRFTEDSFQFCYDLLEQVGVAVTPGRDFGQFENAKNVRFAYTTSLEKLETGVERLGKYLKNIG